MKTQSSEDQSLASWPLRTRQTPSHRSPVDETGRAEDDFAGTEATARDWSIPVFTVWNQSPRGGLGVAS